MRRKKVDVDAAVPAELLTFDERAWDYSAWAAARKEWRERHGWPGGTLAELQGRRAERLASQAPIQREV